MQAMTNNEVTITDLEDIDINKDLPKDPPPYNRPLTPIIVDPKQYEERFGADCPLPEYSKIDTMQGTGTHWRQSQRNRSSHTRTQQPRSQLERTVRPLQFSTTMQLYCAVNRVLFITEYFLSLIVIIFYHHFFLFLHRGNLYQQSVRLAAGQHAASGRSACC